MRSKHNCVFDMNNHLSKKSIVFCCASILALPIRVYAQDDNDAYRLNTVTVSAQAVNDDSETIVADELWVGGKVATSLLDTPASVSIITSKEIERRNATTTEEVLQYSPGIITDYYGSDDRNDYFQIRGFQATTYRDGLTLGSMRGVREDPYAYERVEVIRGANSTLFGPADPGGSVNFVSKRPKFESFGNGYASYGSNNHTELGFDVGDTINENETVAVRFTGKIKDSDLEYDYSRDNSQFFMGGVTWEPTDFTSATLIVDYLGRDSTPNSSGYPFDKEYDRSNFYGEPEFNSHDVDRTNITGQVVHDFDNGLTLRGNVRYSQLEDDYKYTYLYDYEGRIGTDVSRYYITGDFSSEEIIGNTILQYDVSFDRIDSSTLVGVEYRSASNDGAYVWGDAGSIDIANPVYSGAPTIGSPYQNTEKDDQTTSLFLQQNISLDDQYILTVGVRQDFMRLSERDKLTDISTDDDFSETSFRGAFTYKVTDEWSTYISYVESVATPKIGTQPERGEQREIGAKYSPNSFNALFSAAVYDLNKKDVNVAFVDDNGVIEYKTVGESNVKGLDLELKAELFEDFDLTAGYSYMESEVLNDGSDTSIKGKEFTTVPNHTGSLWGQYTFLNDKISTGLGARYIGEYYFDAENTSKSEAATLFDASLSYQFAQATTFSVNVSNLFDKQYVVGSGTANYYNPSREVTATISHAW